MKDLADNDKLPEKSENMDLSMERFTFINRGIFIEHYLLKRRPTMKKETKQITIDIFLKKVAPAQDESQAEPSRDIQEENMINRDHSSVCVYMPQDLPVETRCGGGRQ
jgi:hypothetical protein